MRSRLSLLTGLFYRTDADYIKMEISQIIAEVCRVFNTLESYTEEQIDHIRKKFLVMHPEVGQTLCFMISQDKWPVVRSEGWLIFALISSFPEGARCVGDLMHDVTIFQRLVDLVTDESPSAYTSVSSTGSPSSISPPESVVSGRSLASQVLNATPVSAESGMKVVEMERVDRQNALVFLNGLLRNRGCKMAVMRRAILEDLLKGHADFLMATTEGDFDDYVVLRCLPVPLGLKINVQELASVSFCEFS